MTKAKVKSKKAKIRRNGTFAFLLFTFAFFPSCASKPTDLRLLVPAETLVYLETNDLAAALQPIVDNKAFEQVAKSKPEFSALKGVQLAVAVTGFETTEQKLTDEHSVGSVQPRFVAVADTHAWNYQAVAFADQKLGQFVTDIYGADVTQDVIDKNNGKYFTWTSNDGRKSYAQVIDSLIYFGNDESAIDKCLAVRRGEADSIAKTGKVVSNDPATLASGYVGPDGIAQIANIVGLKYGSEAGEDSEVQSAIAGILPQLVRNSITEINWTARKNEHGIEDKYLISMPTDVAGIFAETLAETGSPDTSLLEMVPAGLPGVTLYDLRDPQIAWRSVLLVLQKQTDPLAGQMIKEFSGALFVQYGINDIEMFLNSVGPTIVTVRPDDVNMPFVLASIKDEAKLKESLALGLKETTVPNGNPLVSVWKSDRDDLAAVFRGGNVMVGESSTVLHAEQLAGSDVERAKMPAGDKAAFHTTGVDLEFAGKLVDILAERKPASSTAKSTSITKTRFTKNGIERQIVSDFGLIGSIIAQLGSE